MLAQPAARFCVPLSSLAAFRAGFICELPGFVLATAAPYHSGLLYIPTESEHQICVGLLDGYGVQLRILNSYDKTEEPPLLANTDLVLAFRL